MPGQLIPAGLLVIVPPAETVTLTCADAIGLKVADTDELEERVRLQVEPLQAPAKPPKDDPVAAVAVRVTWAPGAKLALQVEGQLIPAGLLLTLPFPLTVTVSVFGGTALKLAETEVSADRTSVQEEPAQAPPKPANEFPEAAVAVNVIDVPDTKVAVQVEGQLMPAGALVTVPLPETLTVR